MHTIGFIQMPVPHYFFVFNFFKVSSQLKYLKDGAVKGGWDE